MQVKNNFLNDLSKTIMITTICKYLILLFRLKQKTVLPINKIYKLEI